VTFRRSFSFSGLRGLKLKLFSSHVSQTVCKLVGLLLFAFERGANLGSRECLIFTRGIEFIEYLNEFRLLRDSSAPSLHIHTQWIEDRHRRAMVRHTGCSVAAAAVAAASSSASLRAFYTSYKRKDVITWSSQ
jgi:hypothetical protein